MPLSGQTATVTGEQSMPYMLRVLSAAVSIALLACGVAAADTVTTNFEPASAPPFFVPGTVNGQDGWKSDVPGDIPSLPFGYDQEVIANSDAPAAFGSQSLRISNAYGTGPDTFPPEFEHQTYSKPTTAVAGEAQPNTEYTAEFSFISLHPDREQPGLKISVSPDNGHGGRMSYIGLTDTEDGINVTFFDTPGGEFAGYDLGTLPRDAVHTIGFWMKLNPGPDNDLVRISIDGDDVGQCFTTWEQFYRDVSNEPVPISDRLLFLSGNRDGDRPSLLGGGYLFDDDVTTTTAAGPGPEDCSDDEDIDVDKDTQTRFASPGDLITYRITVRNRGDDPVRRLRVCDRPPRALRFVRSTRRLRPAEGRRLCLTIRLLRPGRRRTFLATFRLRANVRLDSVTNGASADVPAGSVPSPSPPESGGVRSRRRRVASASATLGVQASQPGACPAMRRPRARAAC